jgi:hypothetical protein
MRRRAREGCNAWFWCKDATQQSCYDMQSETWVPWHGCKLLALPILPVAPPDPSDMDNQHEASRFRSFAVGYIKRAFISPLLRLFSCIAVPA